METIVGTQDSGNLFSQKADEQNQIRLYPHVIMEF